MSNEHEALTTSVGLSLSDNPDEPPVVVVRLFGESGELRFEYSLDGPAAEDHAQTIRRAAATAVIATSGELLANDVAAVGEAVWPDTVPASWADEALGPPPAPPGVWTDTDLTDDPEGEQP